MFKNVYVKPAEIKYFMHFDCTRNLQSILSQNKTSAFSAAFFIIIFLYCISRLKACTLKLLSTAFHNKAA